MFGYVTANGERLSSDETARYRSYYCGLCTTLGSRHGPLTRITVNYDMAFLIMVLSSLYEETYANASERCLIHPVKSHAYAVNPMTDYAADMNVFLAYHNLLDDWKDERKLGALLASGLLRRRADRVCREYPRQCGVIRRQLDELARIEAAGVPNPDVPAGCFSALMGEICVIREDKYADDLRAFGCTLGRFIYIMDACCDLERDIKKECYNPMVTMPSDNFTTILNLMMAECVAKYKQLPICQDRGIIENILYSGVWTRYEMVRKRKGRVTYDT